MKTRLAASVFAALAVSVLAAGCIPAALLAANSATTAAPTVRATVTHVIQETPTPTAPTGTSILDGGESIIVQGDGGAYIIVNPNTGVGRPVSQQEALGLALAAAGGGEALDMVSGYDNNVPVWGVLVRRQDGTHVEVYVNANDGSIAQIRQVQTTQ